MKFNRALKDEPISEELKKEIRASTQHAKRFYSNIKEESDRGSALWAMSFLDERLKEILEAHMLVDKNVLKRLFEGPGAAMGTLSMRISFAYMLGSISKDAHNELHLMREIRNEFAHSEEKIEFTDKRIAQKCFALKYNVEPSVTARDRFEASAFFVCAFLALAKMTARRPKPRQDQGLDFIKSIKSINAV